MKINLFKGIYAAALITCILAAAARADNTVSYSTSISGTFDYTGALALQQFNASLGTLQSITITLSAVSLTNTVSITNTSPGAYGNGSHLTNDAQLLLGSLTMVDGSPTVVQSSFDSSVDALNPNSPGTTGNYWVDAYSPSFNVSGLASGDMKTFTNQLGAQVAATSSPITSGAIFAALQGTGTTNLDFFTSSEVNSSIKNGATFSANETVTGTVSAIVTYDYAPTDIPEAGALPMAFCGFGILFYMRKKMLRSR